MMLSSFSCMCSLEKYLFRSSAHLIGLFDFFFSFWVTGVLYLLDISPLHDTRFAIIFSHFNRLMVSFAVQRIFSCSSTRLIMLFALCCLINWIHQSDYYLVPFHCLLGLQSSHEKSAVFFISVLLCIFSSLAAFKIFLFIMCFQNVIIICLTCFLLVWLVIFLSVCWASCIWGFHQTLKTFGHYSLKIFFSGLLSPHLLGLPLCMCQVALHFPKDHSVSVYFFFQFFFFFLRVGKKEREPMWAMGGGKEGERISSRISAERGARYRAWCHDPVIMT